MENSKGNALFLILIAVALFAALSYAVTTSGRGSGDISKEQTLIEAAQMTEFAASVRMAATRLILTGTSEADLQLCRTISGTQVCTDGSDLCSDAMANPENCVFAKSGGGIIFREIPDNAKAGTISKWAFSHEDSVVPANIQGIGTTAPDIYMYVQQGITLNFCEAINKGLGLNATPATDADGITNGYTAYDGEAFFCFDDTSAAAGQYFYIHVIVER